MMQDTQTGPEHRGTLLFTKDPTGLPSLACEAIPAFSGRTSACPDQKAGE